MSKRIYITLNEKKEKDKIILDYLNSTYNECETIKSLLYNFATNKGNKVQFGNKIDEDKIDVEEQKVVISAEKINKDEKMNNNEIIIDKDIMGLFE